MMHQIPPANYSALQCSKIEKKLAEGFIFSNWIHKDQSPIAVLKRKQGMITETIYIEFDGSVE